MGVCVCVMPRTASATAAPPMLVRERICEAHVICGTALPTRMMRRGLSDLCKPGACEGARRRRSR